MTLGSAKLRRPVRDLGEQNPAFGGIYSPGYSQEELDKHIHALFQEGFSEYLRPFPLTRGGIDHWKDLIRDAIPASHCDYGASLRILDLGSGSGTSVFPLLELFSNAEIIASDLSLELLRELRAWHSTHYPDRERLWLLQLNAEDTVFEDQQLDLVTGAHVLHHVANLKQAFVELRRILRPGGVAIFWEPFESGCQIVTLIMQILLERNERQTGADRLSEGVVAGFNLYMADITRRKGSIKSQALLESLDDKWVFTVKQLQDAVTGSGLELSAVRQVFSPRHLIRVMVDHEFRRTLSSLDTQPEWVRSVVDSLDQQFSEELLSEILFSGAIILRSP